MSFRNKRALITGISGFAGSYLANHLVKQGATVGILRRQVALTVNRQYTTICV